jgi:hypothetical protein
VRKLLLGAVVSEHAVTYGPVGFRQEYVDQDNRLMGQVLLRGRGRNLLRFSPCRHACMASL